MADTCAADAIPEEAKIDWNEWVSASRTRSFLLDDPILDWLDHYSLRSDGTPKNGFWHGFHADDDPRGPRHGNYLPETSFSDFIMRKGVEFEAGVLRLIEGLLAERSLPPVAKVIEDHDEIRLWESVCKTLSLMKQGVPVIYQGALWDFENRTYGAPDLLVRSDVLNSIICESLDPDREDINAPNLGDQPWHYVVVDVKFTTLPFDSNGEVGNDKGHYKAQLALYNRALGLIQGYEPPVAFLIGRGWKQGKNRGNSCLDRIGKVTIDQPQYRRPNVDWFAKAMEACEWVRRVRQEGHGWSLEEIPDFLRPVMKNDEDAPWRGAKKEIALRTGELTSVWQLGLDKRSRALAHDPRVTDWRDPLCTPEMLFGQPTENLTDTARRVGMMLDLNRDPHAPDVVPDFVPTQRNVWGAPRPLEFFVDFETVSDLDDDFEGLPMKGGHSLIFMVGCGHFEGGEWRFDCFIADELTPEGELKALRQWAEHMAEVRNRFREQTDDPLVFCWSKAEMNFLETSYNAALQRHGSATPSVRWFDFLSEVMKPPKSSDCVLVKGAFGFGLKAVGKALRSHGLIQTEWADGPTDGLGAMCGAWWCYREAKRLGVPVLDVETGGREGCPCRRLFEEIRDYNEVDCKVMQECIQYLRDHH